VKYDNTQIRKHADTSFLPGESKGCQVAKCGGGGVTDESYVTAAAKVSCHAPPCPLSPEGACGNCQSCRSLDFQNNTRNN